MSLSRILGVGCAGHWHSSLSLGFDRFDGMHIASIQLNWPGKGGVFVEVERNIKFVPTTIVVY